MCRQRTVKHNLSGDLEVDGAVVLDDGAEGATSTFKMQSIPVKSQTVCQERWGSVREIDHAAVGVQKLKRRGKSPARPT